MFVFRLPKFGLPFRRHTKRNWPNLGMSDLALATLRRWYLGARIECFLGLIAWQLGRMARKGRFFSEWSVVEREWGKVKKSVISPCATYRNPYFLGFLGFFTGFSLITRVTRACRTGSGSSASLEEPPRGLGFLVCDLEVSAGISLLSPPSWEGESSCGPSLAFLLAI